MPMFYYTAYGLTICSELALPDLLTIAPALAADVIVRVDAVPPPPQHDSAAERAYYPAPSETLLYWRRAGMFAVRRGREIVVAPAPNVEAQLLSLVVSGPALGVLLHQCEIMTLHASAVAVDGVAVAFLGESGEGKSTTAAAFHALGYPLVCDDTVALGGIDGTLVFPALPRIKLYPQSAATLGYNSDELQVFDSADIRRSYRVRQAFAQQPLPLRHLFVLASSPECRLERLAPRAAFLQLVRHSYALRFVGSGGASATHFRQCEQLLASIPVWRLTRPREFAALPTIIQLVANHVSQPIEL